MPVSQKTALEIAYAYREVESAEKLLADIREARRQRKEPDIRDAFGQRQGGLTLGVPHGDTSRSLFNVPWSLAEPVIEAHIAAQRAIIKALSEQARAELSES